LAGENPDSSNGVHEFGPNTSGSFVTGAPVGQARGYGAPSRHMATHRARSCWDLPHPRGYRGGHTNASVCPGAYSRRYSL